MQFNGCNRCDERARAILLVAARWQVRRSEVTWMMPFGTGVLTAFSNVGGNPSLYRVHYSPNGRDLGDVNLSPPVYTGGSPVTWMMPYER